MAALQNRNFKAPAIISRSVVDSGLLRLLIPDLAVFLHLYRPVRTLLNPPINSLTGVGFVLSFCKMILSVWVQTVSTWERLRGKDGRISKRWRISAFSLHPRVLGLEVASGLQEPRIMFHSRPCVRPSLCLQGENCGTLSPPHYNQVNTAKTAIELAIQPGKKRNIRFNRETVTVTPIRVAIVISAREPWKMVLRFSPPDWNNPTRTHSSKSLLSLHRDDQGNLKILKTPAKCRVFCIILRCWS